MSAPSTSRAEGDIPFPSELLTELGPSSTSQATEQPETTIVNGVAAAEGMVQPVSDQTRQQVQSRLNALEKAFQVLRNEFAMEYGVVQRVIGLESLEVFSENAEPAVNQTSALTPRLPSSEKLETLHNKEPGSERPQLLTVSAAAPSQPDARTQPIATSCSLSQVDLQQSPSTNIFNEATTAEAHRIDTQPDASMPLPQPSQSIADIEIVYGSHAASTIPSQVADDIIEDSLHSEKVSERPSSGLSSVPDSQRDRDLHLGGNSAGVSVVVPAVTQTHTESQAEKIIHTPDDDLQEAICISDNECEAQDSSRYEATTSGPQRPSPEPKAAPRLAKRRQTQESQSEPGLGQWIVKDIQISLTTSPGLNPPIKRTRRSARPSNRHPEYAKFTKVDIMPHFDELEEQSVSFESAVAE